ncbi:MAG TPA: TetR family transcriptional regulator C-terminal domain-containing protein [Steroidobacteraceae bacterium]|nr:TetR family transcriptional regulator C-terminal domain-containing protein [Steroidobacteraceae bacterium]
MGRGASAPKFRRAAPGVRREALVEATLACLRKFGHDGVSVRRISAEAGVSPGLINHHFPSITTLLAAAYETLALTLLQSIRRHTEDATHKPRERLTRFFEASFTPDMLDPTLFNTWLVFWSTVSHDQEMRAVHDRTWGAYRALLESLLGELAGGAQVPAFDVRLAAIALSALLDGLWVESSLNPRTVEPHEAIALCRDWTEALCAGALPSLRAPGARAARRMPRRAAPSGR